jgi:hypothetical protein
MTLILLREKKVSPLSLMIVCVTTVSVDHIFQSYHCVASDQCRGSSSQRGFTSGSRFTAVSAVAKSHPQLTSSISSASSPGVRWHGQAALKKLAIWSITVIAIVLQMIAGC